MMWIKRRRLHFSGDFSPYCKRKWFCQLKSHFDRDRSIGMFKYWSAVRVVVCVCMDTMEVESDNGHIVSSSSCDRLESDTERLYECVCVCVCVCVRVRAFRGVHVVPMRLQDGRTSLIMTSWFPLGRFHLSSLCLLPSLCLSIHPLWRWTSCLWRAERPASAHSQFAVFLFSLFSCFFFFVLFSL